MVFLDGTSGGDADHCPVPPGHEHYRVGDGGGGGQAAAEVVHICILHVVSVRVSNFSAELWSQSRDLDTVLEPRRIHSRQ